MNTVKFGEHSYLPNGHQILIPRNWSKMKLRYAISLSFGLKGVKIVHDIMNLVCMFVYQMGIQIYDQISIPRNCSQVKLRCTVSPRIWIIFRRVILGVLKKKTWDFCTLTSKPEALPNWSKNFWKLEASWTEGYPISIVSSTNCWWEWLAPSGVPHKPLIELASFSVEIDHPRSSAIRINRKGDRGSPWRIPRVGVMMPEGTPLTKIERKADEIKFII